MPRWDTKNLILKMQGHVIAIIMKEKKYILVCIVTQRTKVKVVKFIVLTDRPFTELSKSPVITRQSLSFAGKACRARHAES